MAARCCLTVGLATTAPSCSMPVNVDGLDVLQLEFFPFAPGTARGGPKVRLASVPVADVGGEKTPGSGGPRSPVRRKTAGRGPVAEAPSAAQSGSWGRADFSGS